MRDERISELLSFAGSLGIGDAKVLGVDRITVEDRFRSLCAEPKCPNYNTSVNCPPHSMTPGRFREYIKGFRVVLAFKFDMPMAAVQERSCGGFALHETTAPSSTRLNRGFERAALLIELQKTLCYEHAIARRFRKAANVVTRTRRGPHSPAWASTGTSYQNPLAGRCRRTNAGT
jgi:predicted metal-binding protein